MLVNYYDKYTEMHGQQNIKKHQRMKYVCKLNMVLTYLKGEGRLNSRTSVYFRFKETKLNLHHKCKPINEA